MQDWSRNLVGEVLSRSIIVAVSFVVRWMYICVAKPSIKSKSKSKETEDAQNDKIREVLLREEEGCKSHSTHNLWKSNSILRNNNQIQLERNCRSSFHWFLRNRDWTNKRKSEYLRNLPYFLWKPPVAQGNGICMLNPNQFHSHFFEWLNLSEFLSIRTLNWQMI